MATSNDESTPSRESSTHSTAAKLKEPTTTEVQNEARKMLNRNDTTCQRFAEGTHHAVYAIGDHHVARCLPDSSSARQNLRRDAVVQALAKKSMRKPEVVAEVLEQQLKVAGWRGNLEKRLHGVSLQESQPTERTEDDLAQLLIDLRNADVKEAVAATGFQEEKVNIRARVRKALGAWEQLAQKGFALDTNGHIPRLLKEKVEQVSKSPESPYKPTFLHADINTENILIDPKDGSITGVLDWSDSKVGDPCVDFSGVIFAIGVVRAKSVGKKAGFGEMEIERGWLYAMTEMIRDLRKCLCEERDPHLEMLLRAEWRRVFEGTGLNGVLRNGE